MNYNNSSHSKLNLASSPIVIGANGGSGTRVVAEILLTAGIYLGHDLNKSFDNLSFTYLFKHPYLYAKDYGLRKITALVKLHEKLLFGVHKFNLQEVYSIVQAATNHANNRYGWRWVRQRLLKQYRFTFEQTHGFWGWKEPHTVYFMDGLKKAYPRMKMILLIRNGLDMAYSSNDQQLRYWGSRFGLNGQDLTTTNKFEHWYRSNKETITSGQILFGNQFKVVSFEKLCLEPYETITNLLQFAGIDPATVPDTLWQLPRLPNSYGRHQEYDTSWIDQQVLEKLKELGYEHSRIY